MSLEIYIQGFSAGVPAGASQEEVLAAIRAKNLECELEGEELSVALAGGTALLDASIDEGVVYALAIADPPATREFWELVFTVLKAGPYLLYWPGGGRLVHAGRIDIDDVPEDLLDAPASLVAIASAAELQAAIA
jgi:hypothetical protein